MLGEGINTSNQRMHEQNEYEKLDSAEDERLLTVVKSEKSTEDGIQTFKKRVFSMKKLSPFYWFLGPKKPVFKTYVGRKTPAKTAFTAGTYVTKG